MEIVDKLIQTTKDNFKDVGFWLKLLAYLLNVSVFCLWYFPKRGELGMEGPYQECLFAYSTPAYHAVLFAMLAMYTLGEPPSRYYQTLLLGVGSVLFGTTGVVTIINCHHDSSLSWTTLAMGVVDVIISFVMFIDTLASQGMFKKNKKS